MRAVLCKQFGPPSSLVVEDLPSPVAGPGRLVVSVKACGVNFPDTLIIQGQYQFKPELPFSPGGEVAGIVKAVGEGVTRFKPGDRVIAATTWGGYAEEVVAEAARTLPMPDGMDFATAAAFTLTYGTSHHALKDRAVLQPGETLLVLGAAGGVGLAAVELGKAMGARVIAAASSPAKLAVCRDHGADELIDYAAEDLRERIKALTGGRGVDVVYDPVGGDYSEPALRGMAWRGRFLVVGFAAGRIPSLPLNLPLLKGCAVLGVFWGAFTRNEPELNAANLRELMQWVGDGRLRPHVSARYPLERAADALDDLVQRRVHGKVVLTTED
ncbi:NADPH:quinone oxidoreductase family protein [Variovorax sp.]|uniref:NADPH:quinone oxidoreductase family protein n=1 Tax=Variovorax sp. TaxID=1871043 RepID=UPI001381AB68|nr:NADPH:quinone oxidoreductase family protein [Variovorax sp.]KAF1067616.1 MAG: Quinone oxidoreductase 1 [Variovorax sp.]